MTDLVFLQVINSASVINASLILQYKVPTNPPKKSHLKYRRTQKSDEKEVEWSSSQTHYY